MGVFTHLFRLPRQRRETGVSIKRLLWKRSFHSKIHRNREKKGERPVPAIYCRYADVRFLSDPVLLERGLAALFWPERREKALRCRNAEARLLCVAAGLMAQEALLACGASDLTLLADAQGKPRLQSGELFFNLSHSGRYAACAAGDAEVGVDVECETDARPSLLKRVFREEELAWLNRQAEPGPAFRRLWTRKESYLKYLGTGLAKPMRDFCVLDGQEPRGVRFAELSLPEAALCVCVPSGTAVRFQAWRPQILQQQEDETCTLPDTADAISLS